MVYDRGMSENGFSKTFIVKNDRGTIVGRIEMHAAAEDVLNFAMSVNDSDAPYILLIPRNL